MSSGVEGRVSLSHCLIVSCIIGLLSTGWCFLENGDEFRRQVNTGAAISLQRPIPVTCKQSSKVDVAVAARHHSRD
jgi:hypothetical protein